MIHDGAMGFRLANVAGRAALVVGDHYTDLATHSSGALGPDPMEALARPDLLAELSAGLDDSSVTGLLADVVLGPPVPRPQKSFAVGLNYRAHAAEGGMECPTARSCSRSSRRASSGPTADVELRSDGCDYEGELLVVIGKGGKDISVADAWDHVVGLTVSQDISDRPAQFAAKPPHFDLGKSFDTFGPTGPVLVSVDEVVDRDNLHIVCAVNGEVRQDDTTANLIFDVPTLISYLSHITTLVTGDVIFTGHAGGHRRRTGQVPRRRRRDHHDDRRHRHDDQPLRPRQRLRQGRCVMALNGLLDIELSVPDPAELAAFWERRGLRRTDDGALGTADRDVQLRIAEGTHRHLSALHMSCDTEQDLADIAARIGAMGVESTIEGTTLRCIDPVFKHRVVIDVGAPHPLSPAQERAYNGPGEQVRANPRAEAVVEAEPRPPRRLGHFVLGTPHSGTMERFARNSFLCARIVGLVEVFQTQWTDGRHLRDVLAGLCPVKVDRTAGQDNDAAGRISMNLVAVELIAEADVENTRYDRINAVFRMFMRQ